jgi:hypothetical protein
MEKSVKICFTSTRKEAIVSGVRKAVKRDLACSWLLVGNSSFLNRDIGIMWW